MFQDNSDTNKGSALNKKSKPFLFLWLIIVLLSIIALIGFYHYESNVLKQEAKTQLQSITQSKVDHIEDWLSERQRDIATYTQQQSFLTTLAEFQKNPESQFNVLSRAKAFIAAYGYGRMSILNSDGKMILDVGEFINQKIPEHTQKLIEKSNQTKEIASQLFWDDGVFHFDMVAKLTSLDERQQNLGNIILHINPTDFLAPFVNQWPLQTETGTSHLIYSQNNHYAYIDLNKEPAKKEFKQIPIPEDSNLKHYLKMHLLAEQATLPERYSVHSSHQTEDDTIFTELHVNHAGQDKNVFVYHEHIKDTGWILFSHVDKNEVYASLYELIWVASFLVALTLIILGITFANLQQRERERIRLEQTEKSRSYFMELFVKAPVAYMSLDHKAQIDKVNNAWTELTGYNENQVIGKRYDFFIDQTALQPLKAQFNSLFAKPQTQVMQFAIEMADGTKKDVALQAQTTFINEALQTHTQCILHDITLQKQAKQQQAKTLERTQALLDIVLDAPAYDEKGLLETAMNRMEKFTESKIGFVHFVHEDQNEIELGVWSSNTLKHYCEVSYDNHYPIEKAGIWADCAKTQQINVVNDYATAPNKKGLPEGHAFLQRFISVPIVHKGKVQMILGVGNADQDYVPGDGEALQVFGAELYQLILLKRAHKQLTASERRFHQLFEKAPFAYQSLDENGCIMEVNESWLRLFGLAHGEKTQVIHQPMQQFLTDLSAQTMQTQFPKFIESGALNKLDFQIQTVDGQVKDVEVSGRISKTADGKLRTHCVLLDMTEQRKIDKDLRLAAKVFEETGEGIMVTTPDLKVVSVNQAFINILGFEEHEIIGKTPRVLKSGRHAPPFYKAMWKEINTTGIWQGEIWNRRKNGQLLPEWLTISELKNDHGVIENYVGVFADITKLKDSEAQLDYLAHHDVLTGLINRRRFIANLEYALWHAKRDGKLLAVLMLDLDRFKDVNDSYGHARGDEVLVLVAEALKTTVREVDGVARLGGDEFVVLLEDLQSEDDAARVANKLIRQLSEPLILKQKQVVSVGCSIGISLFPTLANKAEDLIQQADSALYLAKRTGRGTYEYYSAEMTEHAQQRMTIESELKTAVRNNELRVHYQPQVDIATGQLKGVEALVRWQHPTLGLKYPGYFIAVAEESGLIAEIGEWVLHETCRQAKQWLDEECVNLVYAVNISSKQFIYTDLEETILNALEQTGLPAEQLELEITESTLLAIKEDAINLFEYLRGLGVRIAIDDFGTGYSSLAYLKSLPLDVLKVDKSFIDDIPDNETGMQIVNTIISMAHNLRLKVLAEGVEQEKQQRYLQLKGCDYYQGFLTSPALPAEEFATKFLHNSASTTLNPILF